MRRHHPILLLTGSVLAVLLLWGWLRPALRGAWTIAAFLNQSNGRIDFWGQVVDQDDKPLKGVEVNMHVRQWTLAATVGGNANFPKYRRVTDAAGRFELQGANGDVLTIDEVSFPGYRLPPPSQHVSAYAYHGTQKPFAPSATSPVVIRLWKSRGSVPLIHHDGLSAKIAVNGSPLRIDLITGRKTETGGHLEVRLIRDPMNVVLGQRHGYDWSVTLSVPGGRVRWRDDYFGYEAPAEGYGARLDAGQASNDPNWRDDFSGEFYFQTEQGQYGRLKFTLNTFSQPPPCGFYYTIDLNPSGSRNLEYDGKLRIDPRKLVAGNSAQWIPQPPPPPNFVQPAQPKANAPAFPQPPPGFQALTNRGKAFPAPGPVRPPP